MFNMADIKIHEAEELESMTIDHISLDAWFSQALLTAALFGIFFINSPPTITTASLGLDNRDGYLCYIAVCTIRIPLSTK